MVYIQQLYTKCVAEAAYLIVSNGEAAVIDPLRETKPYTDLLHEHNDAKLKYIFETHFHADFVSGHVELSRATGGTPIVYGPLADPNFESIIAKDQQLFKLGDVTITAIHTPGHTMESTCYLLRDEQGMPKALFTGDTLFIGDVGRPDLAQKGLTLTLEGLATHLYNSLRTKVMTLADDLIIYPGHGAGSACGKSMSAETWDTLAHQKATNYALRADMTVEEFIAEVTADLPPPPTYFPLAVAKNKGMAADPQSDPKDVEAVARIQAAGAKPLTAAEFFAAQNKEENISHIFPNNDSTHEKNRNKKCCLVLDVRSTPEFTAGHIPGAVYSGLREGNMGPWVASAIGALDRPYLLVSANEEDAVEALTRLSRFGFDHPLGYMIGTEEWQKVAGKPLATIKNITPLELAETLAAQESKECVVSLVDCRKPGEHKNRRHVESYNVPMDISNLENFDFGKEFQQQGSKVVAACHCAGAYRSVIFCSLLANAYPEEWKALGGVASVLGGFDAMQLEPKLAVKMDMAPCQRAKREKDAAAAAAKLA